MRDALMVIGCLWLAAAAVLRLEVAYVLGTRCIPPTECGPGVYWLKDGTRCSPESRA
jgi:hypothetical protein